MEHSGHKTSVGISRGEALTDCVDKYGVESEKTDGCCDGTKGGRGEEGAKAPEGAESGFAPKAKGEGEGGGRGV